MDVSPEVLQFQVSTEDFVHELLKIKNKGDKVMAFKVKTTAPRTYCVRPNAGYIDAGNELEVQIVLQPFKTLPKDLNCKDKFLVQGIAVESRTHDKEELTELWQRTAKSDIIERKLKCAWRSSDKSIEQPSAKAESAGMPVKPASQRSQVEIEEAPVPRSDAKMEKLAKENASLTKMVKSLQTDLQGEKTKLEQQARDHRKELEQLRKKLEASEPGEAQVVKDAPPFALYAGSVFVMAVIAYILGKFF